jgi:hypothetical protein
MSVCVDDFKNEVICFYKDERYSVRDNGAVLRHSLKEKRLDISVRIVPPISV